MSLHIFEKCWRGRTDCVAIDAVDAVPEGTTEDQWLERSYTPDSFVCCGCVKLAERTIPRDAYRICWKTRLTDDMADHDEQDLAHLLKVVTHTLSVLATRRVAGVIIDTLDDDSGLVSVDLEEGKKRDY